ncbi:hypothetical protein CHS0354_000038 [Potamilus streckersoni]|uniref:Uncharacterized protein n=1 Tax=Potamilus streckersoni TaxID=2493646 RepID=A0AAE0VK01_9BIVA|nr:hypothetical protein CHS0354_000038 [Potamilus streckersoni]
MAALVHLTCFLSVCLFGLIGNSASNPIEKTCPELSHEKEQREVNKTFARFLQDPVLSNYMFNMIPGMFDASINSDDKRCEPYSKPSRFHVYGPRRCGVPDNSRGLNSVSSCPWSIEMETDNFRFPNTIARARCRCTSCMGDRRKCRPVESYIPVVRKHCDIKTLRYEYVPCVEKVPVGCTCIENINKH